VLTIFFDEFDVTFMLEKVLLILFENEGSSNLSQVSVSIFLDSHSQPQGSPRGPCLSNPSNLNALSKLQLGTLLSASLFLLIPQQAP
jgi:hypothetical protein